MMETDNSKHIMTLSAYDVLKVNKKKSTISIINEDIAYEDVDVIVSY